MRTRDRDTELLRMEQAAREVARQVGDIAKRECPPGVGFAVLLFTFGGGGHMTYVSNAQRADMILALREQLAHLETGAIAPAGQVNHPANKPGRA